jgi:hypothetical protein
MGFTAHHTLLNLALWLGLIVAQYGSALAGETELNHRYRQDILPILENYCYDCHGDGLKKGELALDHFDDVPSMIAKRDIWKRIRDHIDFRLMPPPKEVAPKPDERKKLLNWIDDAIFPVDPNNPDPGHVTIRRLNKVEYQNTIRDLLGVDANVSEILPEDDTGYGFDNIGDVLTLSPVHLERYLDAAQLALDQAIHIGPMPPPVVTVAGNQLAGDGYSDDALRVLSQDGETSSKFAFSRPGRYRVEVTASGDWSANQPPKCDLLLNGKPLTSWDVKNQNKSPQTYTHEFITTESGLHTISAAFHNDLWDPQNPDPAKRDRNLYLHQISLIGPLDGPAPEKPGSHRSIYGQRPAGQSDADYMSTVLRNFAKRALRRPPTDEEIQRYLSFLTHAQAHRESVDYAIRQALAAMLVSPSFLFREETPVPGQPSGKQLISEHALASRLSYFLWSSMPDEALFALADAGKLRANLKSEVTRMIASRKSEALIKNFVGQWLQLRDMPGIAPNPKFFPAFNEKTASAMRTETEMLVSHILKNDLPLITLLDADFTFINERLAKFYNIPGVEGKDFRRVSLIGTPRRGLLGQGSFLTLTSYPNRTSPVLRGKFVLENLLDTPPPPPPPNIPQLTADNKRGDHPSLREQMERHRDDPACSSCHALMDPIGFALEHFDGTGAWRDLDRGKPILTAGTLVTGQSFADAESLRQIIVRDHRPEFHRALATKLLTYAIGRGLDWYDRPSVDAIVLRSGADQARLTSMLLAVIESVPFQYRR